MRALATAFSWFPGKMVEKANGRATRAVPGLAGTINSRSGSIFLASPRCRAPTTMTSGQRLSVNIASGAGACGQLPSSLFECHREREARETQFGLHSMSTDPSVNAALYLSRSGGRKLGSALLVSCKAWGGGHAPAMGFLASLVPRRRLPLVIMYSMTRNVRSRVASHDDGLSIV